MTIPTFNELYNSVLSDLKAQLGVSTIFGKSVINAFAVVQAAKLKIMYLLVQRIYDNIFIDTADSEMLKRFGLVKLGRLPKSATACEIVVAITGIIGGVIPEGQTFKSNDNSSNANRLFILDSEYTLMSTNGSLTLRALDLGVNGNLVVGDNLESSSPMSQVDSLAIVTNVNENGIDAESDESYRIAVINSYQTETQGGAKGDYRIWAQDANGVRNIYPYVVENSAGEINIYVEAILVDSIDGKGTPTNAILLDVENVIELDPDISKSLNERGRRPISAYKINYLPIEIIDIDVEIVGLSDEAYLPTILTNLKNFVYNIRPYIAGADSISDINKGNIYISDIYNIVKDTIGTNATFDSIKMLIDSVDTNIYTFVNGKIPNINSIL